MLLPPVPRTTVVFSVDEICPQTRCLQHTSSEVVAVSAVIDLSSLMFRAKDKKTA